MFRENSTFLKGGSQESRIGLLLKKGADHFHGDVITSIVAVAGSTRYKSFTSKS